MKHIPRILTILILLLIVVGGRETAVANKQTLTGQDAVNFLRENGIYKQLAAETGSSFSPQGREFFPTGKIGANDGDSDDRFGISLALDGDTLLVGAQLDDIGGNVDQGSAHIFEHIDGNWVWQDSLTADDGAADDRFGFAVALDGDTALVGAYQADIDGNGNQGAAYVFTHDGDAWSQQEELVADSGMAEDEFGYAVALDDGTALVGAPSADIDGDVDQGAAYLFTLEGGSWNQTARLTAQYGGAGEAFGYVVALDDDTAVIGAPFDFVNFNQNQGSAYVFTRVGNSWSQQARLVAEDGQPDDQFGMAVALFNNTALIGAPLADGSGQLGNENQGAAYIFTREGVLWNQQEKLIVIGGDDGGQNDRFGRSVVLTADTALVSAPRHDVNGIENQGATYVFIREGDSWSRQSKLTANNGGAGDFWGRSVALAGDLAAVGAPRTYFGGEADRGAVLTFARGPVSWLPDGEATADDGEENDQFGFSVALDGDRALVGMPFAEVNGNSSQGAVYMFEHSSGNWVQTAKLTDMVYNEWWFGYSVALEGDIAVVGAPGLDSVVDLGGAAYIFVRESGNNWIQYEMLTMPIREQYSWFGYSVALDGDTVLVGAPGKNINDNFDQGAAFVFIRESNSSWSQQARLLAVDGAEDDEFGNAVALDGDTALVGAFRADVNGNNNQGAAYVFTREAGSWSHQAKLIATDGAVSDWFGYSVALEGNTALVGAYLANVNGHANQGAVYYFARTGNSWSQQAKLTATDGAIDYRFGNAIALDGNTALMGAHLANTDGNFQQGTVYVFVNMGTDGWQQQAKLTPGDGVAGDEFGSSVALDGSNALVGAYLADVDGNEDEGQVYFFRRQPYELFLPIIVR